jgi:hypothetical protein
LREYADKVAHYVCVAGNCDAKFPDEPPVLVLSNDGTPMWGPSYIAGVQNKRLDGADYLQAITSPESFAAMYRFFNEGQEPATTHVIPEDEIVLSGKVLKFHTNVPVAGTVVNIYPLEAATGERADPMPAARFESADDGAWGPFQAKPGVYYEFEVTGDGMRPFHFYRQPFLRSHSLVYLRTLPESDRSDPFFGFYLNELHYNDQSSMLVFFSANRALYYGRDTATVDGLDLVTPEMTPPQPEHASTIAMFIFDDDEDGQTDGGPVPGDLAGSYFLSQYDAFLDARERRSMILTFNGATLHVPAWKGNSEGMIIVVFDYGQEGL